VIKTSIGTASRGIWFVGNSRDLDGGVSELAVSEAFAGEVLVQEWIVGTVEKAQSVFGRGRLLGFHAYRQVAAGVGGGEAIKESVSRPGIRATLEKLGERLAWHGALSIDYLMPEHDPTPRLIDCNPRLVEPMSAYLGGTDLVDLLLRISRGERPAALPEGRAGVRTHLAMLALLGVASRGRRYAARSGRRGLAPVRTARALCRQP
jgi:biotin carboxylase